MDPRGGPGGPGPNADMLYEHVKDMPLTRQNVVWLLFQLSSFVEEEDMQYAKKSSIVLLRNVLVSSVLGVTLNVQLKRIFPPIIKMNRLAAFPIRLLAFAAPYGLFYNSSAQRMYEMDKILYKYSRRIANYQKTADMRMLMPKNSEFPPK